MIARYYLLKFPLIGYFSIYFYDLRINNSELLFQDKRLNNDGLSIRINNSRNSLLLFGQQLLLSNYYCSLAYSTEAYFFFLNSCFYNLALCKKSMEFGGYKNYYTATLQLPTSLKLYYLMSIGFIVPFKTRYFLSGRVNRVLSLTKNYIVFKLGLFSDIILHASDYIRWRKFRMKHSFIIFSYSLNYTSNLKFLIKHLRYRGAYTGRGIRIVRELFILKKRPDFGKFGLKMSFY